MVLEPVLRKLRGVGGPNELVGRVELCYLLLTLRTSDVENPVAGSVNMISVGFAETGDGSGARGDGSVGADGVGDTGLAPSQPVSPIANTKAKKCQLRPVRHELSPTLEAEKATET